MMLKSWIKVLPMFIVEYIAKKNCELFNVSFSGGKPLINVVRPWSDVYFVVYNEDK